ncbi:MAG: hypothetical protein H0W62_14045 [Chitinophagales bacterium]|nr:hypothetical protein [Chitinophagales bacterium]
MMSDRFLYAGSLFVVLFPTIIVLSCLFAFQKNPLNMPTSHYELYEKQWKEVDALEAQGLTKSSLQKADAIYALAKKLNNTPQIVKSLIYKVKYKQVLQEGGYEKTLLDFENEIKLSTFPTKQILQSCAAELYWSYYQQNRWQFSQRTETPDFNKEDPSTWDVIKITQRVTELYKESIENQDSLKELPIGDFAAILVKGNTGDLFRPSLYDFLANRALDFFMNDEAYLTQPANKFDITSEKLFEQAKSFTGQKFETTDTSSGKYLALLILQDLITSHLNVKTPDALVDIELKRFDFLRNNSVNESKDSLYLEALKKLEFQFTEDSASASVSLAIAQFYYNRSSDYQPPLIAEHQWDKKTALNYCDIVLKKFPKTNAAKNCEALRESIILQNINLTTEQVNIPDRPFRGLLQYQNVKQVFFRIIRNTDALNKRNAGDLEKTFAQYVHEPVLQSWSQAVNDLDDYQQHSTEIKIPALPLGDFIIIGSTDESFSAKKNGLLRVFTSVSNLGYVNKRASNKYQFYVFNRETGNLIKNPKARIFTQQYNYNTREYDLKEEQNYVGDNNGFIEVAPKAANMNFKVEFNSGKDTLTTSDFLYLYLVAEQQNTRTIHTVFFTDRSIYRPGQTIYFKGIILQTEGEKNELMVHFKSTVELYDVNDQRIASVDLMTNEYGSFSGSFTAPLNMLNGEMIIKDSYGAVSLSIEEYKRPHFEVTFDSLKGNFRLNQEVHITGQARSYSESNLAGAEVIYRVVRQAKFPVFYGQKKYYQPRFTQAMEIGNGHVLANEEGQFEISFTAIPDLKIPKKENPQFNFIVMADVIDLNGETHSAEANVSVGYIALNADIDIPEIISRDTLYKFKISTKNLNGIFQSAKGTIRLYSLQQPDRIFRKRLWSRPDQFVMTQREFITDFPNDPYDNEDDYTTWQRKLKVLDQSFDTAKDSMFSATNFSLLPQGKYVLEMVTQDAFGEDIKVVKYFTLYSPGENQIPLSETLWITDLLPIYEQGDLVRIEVGTKEDALNVIYEIQSGNNFVENKIISLTEGKKEILIPVSEKYRGGLTISLITIQHGRAYSFTRNVMVASDDRKLELEFQTFRNKLLPGEKEEWKIKITGLKGEVSAAEMVASLYDASLDALKPHQWDFDLYKNNFYPANSWIAGSCFNSATSIFYNPGMNTVVAGFFAEYDQLNWFGFNTVGRRMYEPLQTRRTDADQSQASDIALQKDEMEEKNEPTEDNLTDSKKLQQDLTSIRKNLQETAFFYPQLQTDSAGAVIIKFTAPEALTRWKFLGFAHTKDLKYGMVTGETITQKDLMITPNAPRFLRIGDTLFFSAKVTNLSDHDISGESILQLFNAASMKPVDDLFLNDKNKQSFFIKRNQSNALSWRITVPEGIAAVDYKVIATAGNQSDGEENILPVIANQVLVTETFPFTLRGSDEKSISINKLMQLSSSNTLKNYSLKLEVTSNPTWYALQALPFMLENSYQSADQIFNRFYSNTLASYLANSNPQIKNIFDQWKNSTPNSFISNLEKDPELNSLMLQETPWIKEAVDETERKKRIGLLFDVNRISYDRTASIEKLKQAQGSNGGWSWFPGMPDNRFITQYILTGFGHLHHLGINKLPGEEEMIKRALIYMDDRIKDEYGHEKKNKTLGEENHLSDYAIQYLYARSFFKNASIKPEAQEAFNYYFSQAKKYWLKQNIYFQGMIALALERYGEHKVSVSIIESLKENAITNEETGMYWKNNSGGYFWYEAPIETQALLIEAFDEITGDQKAINDIKLWLLKQKQTQDWKTSKATADAIYALLLKSSSLTLDEPELDISVGSQVLNLSKISKESGTGYFKTTWNGIEVKPEMGNIKITRHDVPTGNNGTEITWGAAYYQYFENADKITYAENPLHLQKKLFAQRESPHGPVMVLLTEQSALKPGDIIRVRMEVTSDRNMEYIHIKDTRAACLEPLNILSGYKWQDGLGYYEETKDASTNFFFDYLPKGTYVFEYPLRVQSKGDFSNGITSIECMYAPEYSSHSEGIRVQVK